MAQGGSGQISDFNLKLNYWYVNHKLQLKKGLILFLILLNVGLFGYSLYQSVMILFVQDQEFRNSLSALPVSLVDENYFHLKNAPLDLKLLNIDSLHGLEGHYDYVFLVNNSNDKWVADRVVAQLVSNQEVVSEKEFFVYPGEQKYVAFFNQQDTNPNTVAIRLADIRWRRFLNFENFAVPRLDFIISDQQFKSAAELGLAGELPISSLSFKIKNATAYSYWQVGIQMILLTSQGTVGGANYFAIDQFRAGETREVEMRWYEPLPPISDVLILPEAYILDASAYMPVK